MRTANMLDLESGKRIKINLLQLATEAGMLHSRVRKLAKVEDNLSDEEFVARMSMLLERCGTVRHMLYTLRDAAMPPELGLK